MSFIEDFKQFLEEYKVMGLAIAFIIGAALTSLVQSLVNDIIMPILSPILSATGEWKEATFAIGPIVLKWGSFLSAVINFVIIAFVVFLIAKMIMKETKVTKK
ncbi:MAG: large conductance mechanosensitive channel protein MscL [Candidatus Aenigmatarchaeota archaeon]